MVRGPAKVHLTFDQGTLLLDPPELPGGQEPPDCFRPDPRLGGRQRAPAIQYRRALASLVRAGVEVDDQLVEVNGVSVFETEKSLRVTLQMH